MADVVEVHEPTDLGPAAVCRVADGAQVLLASTLLDRLGGSRARTLAALDEGGPVYGVTTGMGRLSGLAIGAEGAGTGLSAGGSSYQDDLMLARAVGSAPWLDRRTTRAVVAVRLRTLLDPETGVSPELAVLLAGLLGTDVHPAVPAQGNGAAGEIIPLAHLGGFLTGVGEGLTGPGAHLGAPTGTVPARDTLRQIGQPPYAFAAKEGVTFLQGVPCATARAVLTAQDCRLLLSQNLVVAAAEIAAVRAPRDPYHPALARGDDDLAVVLDALRELAGPEPTPRMLQAPVSFRVTGSALAHLRRSVGHLDAAVERSLAAVSTSPALVDSRFLGTAGFDGFDLAACLDAVRVSVLHVTEVAVARLHRLLDPRVTGLPGQLAGAPGRQAGLVAVHKRAVGLLHAVRRSAAPACLGAVETSLGQEDVQSFALEAAQALAEALDVLRDVTACELLAVHRAGLLDPSAERGSARLRTVLHKGSEGLSSDLGDRSFGLDVVALGHVLGVGWAHDVLP